MYTLQGKTRPTRHTLSTFGPCMALGHIYLTWSTYSNLSWSHQQSWAGPLLPRKMALDTVHNTFNTCSRGPTHRSLTDTGGCYSLGGADFPHTTPRPSQPAVSTFHLRAPPDLRLSIKSLPSKLTGDQTLNLVSGSLHSTSTVTYHLRLWWANDVPPKDRINKDK
jgi:hypothetical protein